MVLSYLNVTNSIKHLFLLYSNMFHHLLCMHVLFLLDGGGGGGGGGGGVGGEHVLFLLDV